MLNKKWRVLCINVTALPGHTSYDPYLSEKSWVVKGSINSEKSALYLCDQLTKKDAWGLDTLNSPGRKYIVEGYYD